MTSISNRAWTPYENELYLAHQLKLLRPPSEQEKSSAWSLSRLLYWQGQLAQEVRDFVNRNPELEGTEDLLVISSQLVDFDNFLNKRETLLSTGHLYDRDFMAVKVKGLKALRGVGPEGRRNTIMRALGNVVRDSRQVGFSGYLSRFYVLIKEPWQACNLAALLKAELNNTLKSLGLDDLEDPPRPHLQFGVGRTWEEAHLVTRGRIAQADVPIDF